MEILTIKIPNGKSADVSAYIKKIVGEMVVIKEPTSEKEAGDDNEVTHEVFFGENIKRLINAFKG